MAGAGTLKRVLLCAALVAAGCGRDEAPVEPAAERPGDASVYWDPARMTPEQLEQARRERPWRRIVDIDYVEEDETGENPERWDNISAEAVNTGPMHLPLHGDVGGPSVLRAQVLLNRALFSPGIIDGRWGDNTEKAIYWFQRREGLPATGRLNARTFERLAQLGGTRELVRRHVLSEADVAGPFVAIPEDIYAHAELECSCYESLEEKLGELFHTTPELLRQLNPGVELGAVGAGTPLFVPNVRDETAGQALIIAQLVVSDAGRYLHALDATGRVVFHFPTTLGSQYDPSPTGDFRVTSITEDPWWHYQPELLPTADDDEPDARIPPGPNNAVGVVWMALNVPHYGIHGTAAPETIGYTTSAGCVRLTNWDALLLARRIREGTPVRFRDT